MSNNETGPVCKLTGILLNKACQTGDCEKCGWLPAENKRRRMTIRRLAANHQLNQWGHGTEKEIFGERLRELLERSGVPERHVADACGMRVETFRKYLSGGAYPGVPTLVALADYFETTVDQLLGR